VLSLHKVSTGGKMMNKIAWEMNEQFNFPLQLGAIDEITSVQITPQWELQQFDESVRLTGIYHIAAKLCFDASKEIEPSTGIFIDHLDVNGADGYFEYALPLEVDLPKEKLSANDVKLGVDQVVCSINEGASCMLTWQVACRFNPAPVVEGKLTEQVTEQATEKVTEKVTEQVTEQVAPVESPVVLAVAEKMEATASDDFYDELAEAYSLLNVRLNTVRRE